MNSTASSIFFATFIGLVLLFLIGPLFAVIPVSFSPDAWLSFPTSGISFKHYTEFATDSSWIGSTGQSLLIALCSAALATITGTAAVLSLSRASRLVRIIVLTLAMLPLVTPAIISALAFYRGWVALGLFDTWLGTILAHAILSIPYIIITVSSAMTRINPVLEMAARSLGANWWEAQRKVVIPPLAPGIMAGFLFAFVMSWDEIVVTLFITSRSIMTLPRRMWDTLRDDVSPMIAVVATLMITITAICILFVALRQKHTAETHP